jgi:hypothetical protein
MTAVLKRGFEICTAIGMTAPDRPLCGPAKRDSSLAHLPCQKQPWSQLLDPVMDCSSRMRLCWSSPDYMQQRILPVYAPETLQLLPYTDDMPLLSI